MASVIEEIVSWSQTRPLWQQDALRRLARGTAIDNGAIANYADAGVGKSQVALVPLADSDLRGAPSSETVRLVAIRDVQNVNSLASGQALTFGLQGLTVVYGDNGAGKSGYARIIKSVTRTRARQDVRNDIFREPGLVPTATIEFREGEQPKSFVWTSGVSGPDDLSRVSFFDSACSDIYLSKATDVAYRPFGLGLFDELVAVCDRVRAELDARLSDASRRTPALPALDGSTRAGRFLQQLSSHTTQDELAEATGFDKNDERRLSFLTELVERNRSGTALAEAERLRLLADRGDRLKTHIDRVASLISTASRDELVRLRGDAETKTEAARAARAEALSKTVLPQVGEQAWGALWEAARAYSESDAYPNQRFPVTTDVCLLCQQPIQPAAANRLEGFEAFVQAFTEKAANAANSALEQAIRQLQQVRAGDQIYLDVVGDLRLVDSRTADAVEGYLAAAQIRLAELLEAIRNRTEMGMATFQTAPTGQLIACLTRLRDQAKDLLPESKDASDALASELAELLARRLLGGSAKAVVAERNRLQLQAQVNAAKSSSSTYAITQKGAELTRNALTEVLVDRFSRETDRLGLEKVVLKTVGGRRGVLLYRTGFSGAVQDAPLPEVLSEGEQTALGMAGFLAEVWTDSSRSAAVFDDPVSSLDHERRDKVAERLVSLSQDRQTIVFTHDVAFVLALKKHAVLHSVAVTERSVERLHTSPGHCQDNHKFSAKLVKERLGELDSELTTLRAKRSTVTDSEYRDATSRWYRLLRRTWEKAIEESLVGDILTRDDLQVHPAMVRTLVLFTADDNRALQHGYGRATELSEVHDESPVINALAPQIQDLEADLRSLREWHKAVSSRRNLQEDKIYEMVGGNGSPPG